MRTGSRGSGKALRQPWWYLFKRGSQKWRRMLEPFAGRARRMARRCEAPRSYFELALRWRFKLALEALEPKWVLSGNDPLNVFAEAQSSVIQQQTTDIPISLEAPSFSLAGDSSILSFRVRAQDGSLLDPAAVQIRDSQGTLVPPILALDDLLHIEQRFGGPAVDSLTLVDLEFGDYTVEVSGQQGTAGDFELDVALVGDLDGDRDVELDDREGIRELQRTGGYQLEADANLDGRITSLDYVLARRNLGDSTTHDLTNSAPTATADEFTLETRTLLTSVAPGLLINDSDPDFFSGLQVIDFDPASTEGATVVVAPDGGFSYDPDGSLSLLQLEPGESLMDTFTYRITDIAGAEATATVTVDFTAPDTVNDSYSTDEETPLAIGADVGVLLNDGDTLAAVPFAGSSNLGGAVALQADGSFTYHPTGSATLQQLLFGETTLDTFTYEVTSGGMATVTILVFGIADDPEDVDQTDEDTPLVVAAGNGVLQNDPGVNPQVIESDTTSLLGAAVQVAPDGSYTYDPTGIVEIDGLAEGETVLDRFDYRSSDGNVTTDTTVTVIVNGRNDVPVAQPDAAETDSATPIDIENPLANDTEPDTNDDIRLADPIPEVVVKEPPKPGEPYVADSPEIPPVDAFSALGATISINEDLSIHYDPTTSIVLEGLSRGETITDQFTYRIQDESGEIAEGVVSIEVTGIQHPVMAVDDAYEADEDVSLIVGAAEGLLANDTDADATDELFVLSFDELSSLGAEVAVEADGTFAYDATHVQAVMDLRGGETLEDTFSYTVADGQGCEQTAQVAVTIHGNVDGPDDAYLTDIKSPLAIAMPGVLINDPLANPQVLIAQSDDTSKLGAPVTLNPDGSFTYDATALNLEKLGPLVVDGFLFDSFMYTAEDTVSSETIVATVSVAVDVLAKTAGRNAFGGTTPNTSVLLNGMELVIANNSIPTSAAGVRVELIQAGNSLNFRVTARAWGELPGNPSTWWWIGNPVDLGTFILQTDFDRVRFIGTDGNDGYHMPFNKIIPLRADTFGGRDYVQGGAGDDVIDLGFGSDTAYSSFGNDIVLGGAGHDQIFGGSNDDRIDGGFGDDLIKGGGGDDILTGGPGHDMFFGDEGRTWLTDANRSEGDSFNPNSSDTINIGNDIITGIKSDPQTERDLVANGHLVASINSDRSVLTVNGPSLYGFTIEGGVGAFDVIPNGVGGHDFRATSPVVVNTGNGDLPLPASNANPLVVATSADPFTDAGNITSFNVDNLLLFDTTSGPTQVFGDKLGLGFVSQGMNFGLALGKDLSGLGVGAPLNNSIPYFFLQNVAGTNLFTFGGTSVSAGEGFDVTAALDLADPFFYFKVSVAGGGFTLGGGWSSLGNIPFVPNQTPSIFSGVGEVLLKDPTSTIDQTGFEIANAVDGIEGGSNGWGVFGGQTQNQTAVFQTVVPLSTDELTLELVHNGPWTSHKARKFRLATTRTPDPTVTNAVWSVVDPHSVETTNPASSASFDSNGFVSIAGNATGDTYKVVAHGPFDEVTGFRLELVTAGPNTLGFASNGNTVLSEFKVTAARDQAARPELFGNLLLDGKVTLGRLPVSLEGNLVLDLDANDDGNLLGINGDEAQRLADGLIDLDDAIGAAFDDLELGINGKGNIEVPLGQGSPLGLTFPVASASIIFKDQALAFKGGTVNPFAGTVLDFIETPSASLEGFITDENDFGVKAALSNVSLGAFGLTGSATFEVDNIRGAFFDGRIGLPILGNVGHVTGAITTTGLAEFRIHVGAAFNAGPVSLNGHMDFRIANFEGTLTNPQVINGVTFAASAGLSASLDFGVGVFTISASGQLAFSATSSGVSISGSGNITGTATIGPCPVCVDICIGLGFSFNNYGFTLDLPSPVPDLTVSF